MRSALGGVQVGQRGSSKAVDAEQVEAVVPDVRRSADRVEDPLDSGAQVLLGGRAALAAAGIGGSGEIEQVAAFGLVELQRAGERLEDGLSGSPACSGVIRARREVRKSRTPRPLPRREGY